jgi:hypothetical protein
MVRESDWGPAKTYLGWNEGRKSSASDVAHLDDYQRLSAH